MKRLRQFILLTILILFTGTIWLLWVRPKAVDMTQFAPANALFYVEANQPTEVLAALANTDAWRLINRNTESPAFSLNSGWWKTFIRNTGIGPIDSVIVSRAQVAIVVTSVGSTELGDTLRVKPEAAIIVETHTSERRIRAPIERQLQRFAAEVYDTGESELRIVEGVSILEWRDKNARGQLVAAFVGTVVIVGNSQQVVDSCVAVVRRRAPSLQSHTDLQSARASQDSANALAFGYVPAASSPRLVAAGIHILAGRGNSDPQFQSLVQSAASKLIGSIFWTSRTFRGGIEDRYQIELQPGLVAELSPHFGPPSPIPGTMLSTDFSSVSNYRLKDPFAAWQSLKTSVSRRVDALAAVVFNSTLRTGLNGYGIEDPESFLTAVKSPLTTVRLDPEGQRQILVASVSDRAKLEDFFAKTMRSKGGSAYDPSTSIMENSGGNLSVALSNSLIVIGHPVDVQHYYRLEKEVTRKDDARSARLDSFVDSESDAHITTYSDDSERVRAFLGVVAHAFHKELSSGTDLEIAALPYATTQTSLTGRGFTRITRSPLGQFSTVIPMIAPDRGRP